ncbi:thiamine-phosphate pyrophosphorylase [Pedobacter psychrotolerans]|uniref:Thiamine phosphate synthase n=1 Tax=Pedobacter psychrotolerans TaxID=1843235 RepID=A0A4R2H9W6_9SPHI|nr:thiamine phosphate synthase [Pedobacter psychrotolerans]TCO22590.1 thiamine-phosphate pyrophosphorylase [Pedobacter psychrotolerans]GGE65715.1 thiamine phosphate synthase [Pedobacter psychrotolerans]
MDLIVISAPQSVDNEAAMINQLFDAGLTRFHLRKPEWNIHQFVNLLEGIDQAFHPNIALHQHHMLTDNFNIKRLHYPEKHRVNSGAEKWYDQKQKGYVLSTSIHHLAEIPLMKEFEYVFFSPVFNSLSKPGYQSLLEEDFVLKKKNHEPKVIALGGVDETNLKNAVKMNFNGVAILGAIWNTPELATVNFKKLNNILNNQLE